MALSEYEQCMIDAQSAAASAMLVAAELQAEAVLTSVKIPSEIRDKISRQIEGLQAKLRWPHLTRAEKAAINQKINELKETL